MKIVHTCAVFNSGFDGLSACQNIARFKPPPSVAENIMISAHRRAAEIALLGSTSSLPCRQTSVILCRFLD